MKPTTCLRFWGWVPIGALAVVSLDLGPLVELPVLLLGGLIAVRDLRRVSTPGLVTGAGLPLLWVAYVQRQGPGTTCWHTATAAGCDQYLDPLPWLVIGIILVLAGLVSQARHRALPTDQGVGR